MSEEILLEIEKDSNSCKDKHQKETRKKALLTYYSNPVYCKFCGSLIKVPFKGAIKDTRKKQFCNVSCLGKSRRKEKIVEIKPVISDDPTKKELFDRCKNYQSARSTIRKRAQQNYQFSNKPKKCSKCGYDKHYEVCHVRSVSDFPGDALVSEINNIENLIALCPNCHWEFDHNI